MSNNLEDDFAPRNYQIKIMEIALKQNTIIYLPTGSGKTLIAVMILKQLSEPLQRPISGGGKISILLVNTVALVDQQAKVLRSLTHYSVGSYSGNMNVDSWDSSLWKKEIEKHQIFVMTAQILVNLITSCFLSLNDVNLLIFDECHQAVDDHPMRQIMANYQDLVQKPRVVGLTATLLNRTCKQRRVVTQVQSLQATFYAKIATINDLQSVIGYSTNPKEKIKTFRRHIVSPTEICAIKELEDLIITLTKINITRPVIPPIADLRPLNEEKGLKNLINLISDAIYHIRLFGIFGGKLALTAYSIQLERIKRNCLDKKLVTILNSVGSAFNIVKILFEHEMKEYSIKTRITKFSSYQLRVLIDILREFKSNCSSSPLCGIIFVQRRFTAKLLWNILKCLKEYVQEFEDLSPDFIVGINATPSNNTREGLYNSKVNTKVIKEFINKKNNLLVASNILEEGVDIPVCNLIISFDSPKNYRSYVQTKGRARHKDSYYYIMVNEDHKRDFTTAYAGFKKVEQILNEHLLGKNKCREAASAEQIEPGNEYEFLPYYVSGPYSAHVTVITAISLLCRYCAVLPSDRYTVHTPNWYLDERNDQYRVIIELPVVCPVVDPIEGPFTKSKKQAKRAAALKACEVLHKLGELDDVLLPKKYDSVDEDLSYYFTHWPTNTETAARLCINRRIHTKQIPQIIKEQLLPNKAMYLHVIKLQPSFSNSSNAATNMLYKMYTSQLCFGVITAHMLPKICQFSVYVSAGEIAVTFKVNQKQIFLSLEQIYELRCFHYLIFSDVLKLLKSFLIFDNDASAEVMLVAPLQVVDDNIDINFEILYNHKELIDQKTEPNVQDKVKLVINIENYLGKIVTPWYRSDDQQYLVTDVCTDLNPCSKFPSEDFQSYASYFKEKYHTNILNMSQPLLLVKGLSKRLTCLKPRGFKAYKRSRDQEYEDLEEHLIPELCVKQEFPAALWIQASLLPSILYRIYSLLQADELRRTIVSESKLGMCDLPAEREWKPLILDKFIVEKKVKKSKKEAVQIHEVDNSITAFPHIVQQLAQDFDSKKLEMQFPWSDKDEPIDIERNLNVTRMDIQYYENFLSQKISPQQTLNKDEVMNKNSIPEITFDKDYVYRTIDLLQPKINNYGPELADIFTALTTAKNNDIVNLERLETLGDSFLKLSISLFIILRYPGYNEGKATNFKGKLISNKNLYYIGTSKKLGGYLKISEFAPTFEWKPPCFSVPNILSDIIHTNKFPATDLFNFPFSKDAQINGVLDTEIENRIQKHNEQLEEKVDDSAYDSMLSFLDVQIVADKTIADCVEALLGVYFQSCGFKGGLIFLKWLGIVPESENLENMLQMKIPSPVLNNKLESCNIDFFLPAWKKVEEILDYNFKDKAYLLQALTHASYKCNRTTNCYQRLEFLGDAVLDFLITCYIYETSDNLNPGQLTDLRSALVNNVTFAGYTVRCGFHKFLLFSNNQLLDHIDNFAQFQDANNYAINDEVLILLEEKDLYMAEHVDVPKVLGDIFEALAGAVFLDCGMDLEVVWKVFYRIMWKEIESFRINVPKNAIRLIYETLGAHPEFHEPIQIQEGKTMIGLNFMLNGARKTVYGFGENKLNAKKAASKIALRLLHK